MNRFTRYGVYAILSGMMVVLIVAGQHLIMTPIVYSSIEQMGDRLGRVLPYGHSEQSRLVGYQPSFTVTLVQPTGIPVVRRGEHPELARSSSNTRFAGLDLRVPVMVVVMYLAALFLVSTISLWRHTREDFRTIRPWAFVGILSVGSGVCVMLATLFWIARVFWTGVDQAFYSRSIIHGDGSSSTIRVRGDQLLAMGSTEVVMMLIAMVLTALPILIWIDLKLFRRVGTGIQFNTPVHQSLLSRFYEHKLIDKHFSERSIKRLCGMCYAMVVLFLWTSPWSMTIANAIWMS